MVKQNNIIFLSFQTMDLFILHLHTKDENTSKSILLYRKNVYHSKNLMQSIELLLNEASLEFKDISSVYIVVSPGSFMLMRLAQTLVISLMVINEKINVYLTSSFLLSYFFFMKMIGDSQETWKSIKISISKTKTKYYSLNLVNNLQKKEKWYISKLPLDKAFSKPLKNCYICVNYSLSLGKKDYLFFRDNISLLVNFVNSFNNIKNQDLIKTIIEGGRVSQKDFDKLYVNKSMFLKLLNPSTYPNFDSFMELI